MTLAQWQVVGFIGQAVFTARLVVQWVASERKRDSVVPVAFWWLSLLGGLNLLVYAVHTRDPVFITGQAAGTVVYVRNLMLVNRRRKAALASSEPPKAAGAIPPHHLDLDRAPASEPAEAWRA